MSSQGIDYVNIMIILSRSACCTDREFEIARHSSADVTRSNEILYCSGRHAMPHCDASKIITYDGTYPEVAMAACSPQ